VIEEIKLIANVNEPSKETEIKNLSVKKTINGMFISLRKDRKFLKIKHKLF
jgi:hypothetical protein